MLDRSIIACLLGLFNTERLASEMSAVTRVIDILQNKYSKRVRNVIDLPGVWGELLFNTRRWLRLQENKFSAAHNASPNMNRKKTLSNFTATAATCKSSSYTCLRRGEVGGGQRLLQKMGLPWDLQVW